MRKAITALGVVALLVAVAIGLSQAGSGGAKKAAAKFDLTAARAKLAGSPAPLAALHEQSAELLDGGRAAFEGRLRDLRGHPVVVNKWASWCGPCRTEFPVFQNVATSHGKTVAFLGLNSSDNRQDATGFLREYPLPYPSYVDPKQERIARSIGAPTNYPITVFYDARGRRAFVHQGQYRDEADLVADIERYAR
jgi:thiol-disulfide isomerase/thioredoxin